MRSGLNWRSWAAGFLVFALICGSLACPVAAGIPAPAPEGQGPAAPEAEQHGGGGFALLLLDYRLMLEDFTQDLRERAGELGEGVHLMPLEAARAWQRVVADTDPVFQIAALLAILAAGVLARYGVRRRLGGLPLEVADATDGFGLRLGRALHGALIDLLGLGAFAWSP